MNRLQLLGVWIILLVTSPALAQPSAIPDSIIRTRSLSPAEENVIDRFAQGWANVLRAEDPQRVHEARRRLTTPLFDSPSDQFRFRYGNVLIPLLETIIAGEGVEGFGDHRAVNALQVIGAVKTDRALAALIKFSDAANEQRWVIRRQAAMLATAMIRDSQQERIILNQVRVQAGLDQLESAAGRETNWSVLDQHFQALATQMDSRGTARLNGAINAVLDRIERPDSGPSELMRAVHYALYRISTSLIDLPEQEQRTIGRRLAPTIGRVLDIARSHWDSAQQQDNLKRAYSGAVSMSERVLTFVDPLARGAMPTPPRPSTNLQQHWDRGSREQFVEEVRQWRTVLSSPPYS